MGRLLWAVVLLSGLLLFGGSGVSAHGGGTPRLTDEEAGPYRLFVWTEPEPWRVGEVHVTVAVTLPSAAHDDDDDHEHPAVPVDEADVVLRFLAPDGSEYAAIAAAPASLGAGYYEADTDLDQAGEWRVAIDVSGPDGAGMAEFAIEVIRGRSLLWLWAIGAILLIAVLLLWRVRRPKVSEPVERAAVDLSASDGVD